MHRNPVTSSNIKSVGYDEVGKILEVEFQDGGVYQYKDVEPVVHQELVGAESVGKYFHQKIKKVYEFSRVELDVTGDKEEKQEEGVFKEEDSPLTRDELRNLRDRAMSLSRVDGVNPLWVEAYVLLATACDRIDAMLARSEEKIADPAPAFSGDPQEPTEA